MPFITQNDADEEEVVKVPPEDPNAEPKAFTAALKDFGQRTRRDIGYFLEAYVQMCVAANEVPVPQLFYLFQSREKKQLLKRMRDNKACIYLAGNDPACRRRITDQDLKVVSDFLVIFFSGHLTSIDLRFNILEDVAGLCQLIIKSPTVTELNLMFNNLTDYGVSSLRNALLVWTKLTSYGAFEIASLVGELPTLRYLNLSYSELTIEAVIAIFIPLRANISRLECLDLTSPFILDCSSRAVLIDHCSRMLISNVHLIELHLAKIALDDFELDRLLIGLRRNHTLRYLNLHSNKLNRDGARLLMEFLMENHILEVLDLDSNHLTDEGVEYLSNAIYENSSLKMISLRYCAFGNPGLRYLTVGMLRGSLERLNVWQGVSLTGDGCKAFSNLIWSGRIKAENMDAKFYQVDGQWSMAEQGESGLHLGNVYSPTNFSILRSKQIPIDYCDNVIYQNVLAFTKTPGRTLVVVLTGDVGLVRGINTINRHFDLIVVMQRARKRTSTMQRHCDKIKETIEQESSGCLFYG
ncbi:putative Leucine-rich repeat-containing protein 34 [Hypsibius exemplaris]|uniref:Leucine-rich repeat-containing protein 34 n=1 Tax=Hypsibius exemplaris TaxID=2072580 RepID=A0A1W0WLF4_HYPEX|nr:putative Leucine-rich repeat-containing protein 34 [Hypsibius exemplaris]